MLQINKMKCGAILLNNIENVNFYKKNDKNVMTVTFNDNKRKLDVIVIELKKR